MNDLYPDLLHPAPGSEDLERRKVDAALAERSRIHLLAVKTWWRLEEHIEAGRKLGIRHRGAEFAVAQLQQLGIDIINGRDEPSPSGG